MRNHFIGTGFEGKGNNRTEGVKNAFNKIYRQFLNIPEPQTEEERMLALIRKAQIDWRNAESKFNDSIDEALIDHCIYDMMAAQSRYTYLISEAKRKGIHV